jgi:hypothetical protein
MAEASNPKVVLKKKQIPLVIDFCIEEGIEFSAKQQTFPDIDWELDLKLKDFKTAVLLGMFLRESRIDINGIDPARYKRSTKKTDEKTESTTKPEPVAKEEKLKTEKPAPENTSEPRLI